MKISHTRKDGGWGWVIVFAAFMVNFLIDGVRYSFGIMLVEWHDEFQGGLARLSWIASFMFGLILIAAPLSAALVNKFGCRTIVIAGTLTSFTGLIASVFVESVLPLYFTFGVLGGTDIESFTENNQTQNTDPSPALRLFNATSKQDVNVTGLGFSMMFITGYVVVFQYFEKRRSLAIGLAVLGSGSGGLVFNPFSKWLLDEYGWRGTLLIESGILLNAIACGLVMRPVISEDRSQTVHTRAEEDENKLRLTEFEAQTETNDMREINTDGKEDGCYVPVTQELLNHQGGQRTSRSRANNGQITSRHDTTNLDLVKEENAAPLVGESESDKCIYFLQNIKSAILKTFRFDLLLRKRFLCFAVVIIFINISFMVPFIYVFDMALAMGHPPNKAVWLMTSMGISNVVSRIPVGVVADLPRVNKLYMMALLYVSAGVFTAVMPVCHMYELLLTACIMYSASIVSGMVLIPIVLSKLFGDEVIADSFGLSLLFGGIAGLIGPVLTGALFDKTNSYHAAFITAGAEFVIGGLVLCLIPRIGPKRSTGQIE